MTDFVITDGRKELIAVVESCKNNDKYLTAAELYKRDIQSYREIIDDIELHKYMLRRRMIGREFVKLNVSFSQMSVDELKQYHRDHYKGLTLQDIASYCGHENFKFQLGRAHAVLDLINEGSLAEGEKNRYDPSIKRFRQKTSGVKADSVAKKYGGHFTGGEVRAAIKKHR